jgi:hypothetical protein
MMMKTRHVAICHGAREDSKPVAVSPLTITRRKM